MKKSLGALLLLLGSVSCPALADRISQMNQTDLCTYTAKLQVAGYYYFMQGLPRDQVKIHWHGDETRNEIDFISRTLDRAYGWLASTGASESTISAQRFGDLVYDACMRGIEL